MELINFIDNYKNAKIHMRINYVKPSFKIIKKEIVSFKSDELINYLKENKIDNIYICDDIAEELKNNYKCKFENDCFFCFTR